MLQDQKIAEAKLKNNEDADKLAQFEVIKKQLDEMIRAQEEQESKSTHQKFDFNNCNTCNNHYFISEY